MFDYSENTAGDVVQQNNELEWRQKFAVDSGHEMECIEETVADMAELMSKVCGAWGNLPLPEIVAKMDVEKFDTHIRAILDSKQCNCKNHQKKAA